MASVTALWTLEEGLQLARKVENLIAPDFHVALGGGVMKVGFSNKDVDLIIWPSHRKRNNKVPRQFFKLAGLVYDHKVRVPSKRGFWRTFFAPAGADHDYEDINVDVMSYNGKRVDLIFMECN